MNHKAEFKIKEVIQLASKLKWIKPSYKTDYPLMQMSEVEKCMLAMVDDIYLERMKRWVNEQTTPTQESQS